MSGYAEIAQDSDNPFTPLVLNKPQNNYNLL